MFIPTAIKTKHPLADSMGNPLTLAYVGPSDIGGPFAFCWQGEPMDRFTAEEIHEILSEGELRTTPKGKTYMKINW